MDFKKLLETEKSVGFTLDDKAELHQVQMRAPSFADAAQLRGEWYRIGSQLNAARERGDEVHADALLQWDEFNIRVLKAAIEPAEIEGAMDDADWHQLVVRSGGINGNLLRSAYRLCGLLLTNDAGGDGAIDQTPFLSREPPARD